MMLFLLVKVEETYQLQMKEEKINFQHVPEMTGLVDSQEQETAESCNAAAGTETQKNKVLGQLEEKSGQNFSRTGVDVALEESLLLSSSTYEYSEAELHRRKRDLFENMQWKA